MRRLPRFNAKKMEVSRRFIDCTKGAGARSRMGCGEEFHVEGGWGMLRMKVLRVLLLLLLLLLLFFLLLNLLLLKLENYTWNTWSSDCDPGSNEAPASV